MIELDTEAIVRQLAGRIAQLEVDLAVARSQIPPEPEPETGSEVVGDGVRLMEVIDGEKEEDDEEE